MKKINVYIALALAALLGACAPVKKEGGASAVEKRAQERWNLLIAHQAEKAYDYLTPGFRLTTSRDKYAAKMNDTAVRWKGAHVGSHTCDADTCTVTMLVDVQVIMPGIGSPQSTTMPVEEHWIRADNVWYFLPDWNLKALPGEPAPPAAPPTDDAAKHPI